MNPRRVDLDEAMDQCLAETDRGVPVAAALVDYPEIKAELGPLVDLALTLRQQPPVVPDPAFRRAARARLLAQAAATRSRRGGFWGLFAERRWATAMAAGVGSLLLSGGLAVASADSLPGDPLYAVKLASEDAQITLAPSDEARAGLHLQFAERRVDEATRLAVAGRAPEAAQAVQGYEHRLERAAAELVGDAAETSDTRLPSHVEEALSRHEVALSQALAHAPNEASRLALQHALEVSRRGRARAVEAPERKGGPPPVATEVHETGAPAGQEQRPTITGTPAAGQPETKNPTPTATAPPTTTAEPVPKAKSEPKAKSRGDERPSANGTPSGGGAPRPGEAPGKPPGKAEPSGKLGALKPGLSGKPEAGRNNPPGKSAAGKPSAKFDRGG